MNAKPEHEVLRHPVYQPTTLAAWWSRIWPPAVCIAVVLASIGATWLILRMV